MAHSSCATIRLVAGQPLQVHLHVLGFDLFRISGTYVGCENSVHCGSILRRSIIMLPLRPLPDNLSVFYIHYLQVSKHCTSVNSQRAINRIGNVARISRLIAATRLPGVSRWEGGGLRASLLRKPEMAFQSMFGEKLPSKDVVCSCK